MPSELPPLTPEQRRQIFEEERARFAAPAPTPAPAPAPAPASGVTLSRGVVITLSVVGILFVGGAVAHAFHSWHDDSGRGRGSQHWMDESASMDECPMMQQRRNAQKETRGGSMRGDGMMQGRMMQRFDGQQTPPNALPAPNDGWMTENGPAAGMHQMPDGTWMGNDGSFQQQ